MPFWFDQIPQLCFRDMLNKYVSVYLDDILIFSQSCEDHIHHVQTILQHLLENYLFINAEKCEFHAASVAFLGYIIGQGNMQMDPEKVSALTTWPILGDQKQLQRFLPLLSPRHPEDERRHPTAVLELDEDTQGYVSACPVCNHHKLSHQAPVGLLQPLPVPHDPWSHISLDSVTGLSPSDNNTTILTVVDWFSKMAHFIPLLKLPSAKETAMVVL